MQFSLVGRCGPSALNVQDRTALCSGDAISSCYCLSTEQGNPWRKNYAFYFQKGLWHVFDWTITSLMLLFQGVDRTDDSWHGTETVRKGRIQVITLAPVQGRNGSAHVAQMTRLLLASKTAQNTLIRHGGITGVNLPLAWKRSVNKEQERWWHHTCPETVCYYYFLIKPWQYNPHV